jgi:hypothetical protein
MLVDEKRDKSYYQLIKTEKKRKESKRRKKKKENHEKRSQRLPTATVDRALELARDECWHTMVQPDLAHFVPSRGMEVLAASASTQWARVSDGTGKRCTRGVPHGLVDLAVDVEVR